MSQLLTSYHALYESLRSRRVKPELPKNLDRVAARAVLAAKSSAHGLPYLRRAAEAVDGLRAEIRGMSEAALDHEVASLREQFLRGRADEAVVRRALAVVREVARRATGEEAFLVQLMGALALYHGRIVEMLTGEGKTLTGSLAAPLIAWRHRHVHIFTVNDYLAARDAKSRSVIYSRCLLECGAITQELEPGDRARIYAKGVVYGTPKQITADWLRDQIRLGRTTTAWAARAGAARSDGAHGGGPMIPGLRAALVDEADAVLIDEGVVPLIIARSRREDEMAPAYREAREVALRLDEGPDYTIDHTRRRCELKSRGEDRLDDLLARHVAAGGQAIFRARRRAVELVRQALVAEHCYKNGQQYQVVDGKIIIVDEYTGRFLHDRTWEHGLHQAVEAKEGLEVTADRETLARMSFQRFFRSYPFLAGMTGTAADATGEIKGVYARPVTPIPTNRPLIRRQWPLRCFKTQRDKWAAIVASVEEVNRAGRPILIGTRSIAASELVAGLLTRRGLAHQVLNANFDKEEADLISRAGHGDVPGTNGPTGAAITVATNMAGRGTDILLDDAAKAAGGLHVLLTEVHGALRIDRQFIGRAGRQGDPGSAQVFASLEDELLRRDAPRASRLLSTAVRTPELPTRLAELLCRAAQRRNEARDRRNRASVLRQDEWIDKHLPGA